MTTAMQDTPEMSDEEWEAEREATTQRFFGVSAKEFVDHFKQGEYEDDDTAGLMQTLMVFPELQSL